MKKKLRRLSIVSMLAVSIFVTSTMVRVPSAHALLGTVSWPLLIVGAVLGVGGAVGSAAGGFVEECRGHDNHARAFWALSLTQLFAGLLLLDDQTGVVTFQELTAEQAHRFGLAGEELVAYNRAVLNGDMQRLFQQADYNLGVVENPTAEQAKEVMHELLQSLPADARGAFSKIARGLVLKHAR